MVIDLVWISMFCLGLASLSSILFTFFKILSQYPPARKKQNEHPTDPTSQSSHFVAEAKPRRKYGDSV